MSAWNDFQRSCAGSGMSRSEVSAAYHASRGSCGGSSSSSYSSSSYSAPSYSSSSYSSAPASRGSSSWNDFQRSVAGQGLSASERSALYQASKSSGSTSSSTSAARSVASSTTFSSSLSAWNQYQRDHAGQNLTREELSRGYQAQKAAATSSGSASQRPNSAASQVASTPLTWNEFQRQKAGNGYTQRQISLLYQDYKAKTGTATADSTTTTATKSHSKKTSGESGSTSPKSVDKPARRPNAFNEFQKQYKKDHPDERLSTTKLAKLYREQQGQEPQEVPYKPLRQRLRERVEQLMLDMTLNMEDIVQQSAPQEDFDEMARIIRQLEAEEGNLNRKAFVDAHESELTLAEDDEEYADLVSALSHCEVIDASRLELTMDDASRIGSGGSGVVYTAMLDTTTPVAVKVVDGVNTKAKDRFEQEMLSMMKASAHENVLRVLGYSVFNGSGGRKSFGIVMELMAGGDLAYVMHREESVTLTTKDLLQKLLQVIKAIEYIHSQGITHRDMKPHNILLSKDLKTAKLADFGLTGFKNATVSTRQSQSGDATNAMGLTPAYSAPEVIQGTVSSRDTEGWKKSDVFSFTVLLTEAVMGEQPWEFETPQFIMNSVSKLEKRPFDLNDLSISSDSAKASDKLRALVRDGWHQDPSKRPTARDVRKRLEKIVAAVESTCAASSPTKKSAVRNSAVSSPRGVDLFA